MLSGAVPFYLLLSSAVASLAVALLAVTLLAWALRGGAAQAKGPAATGVEGMIGEVGVVRVPVGGDLPGRVFVHGERWRAVPAVAPEEARGGRERFIEVGRKVRVVEVRGGEVVVAPVEPDGFGRPYGG